MIIIQLATFSSQPVNFQGFFVISNVAQVRNTWIKYINTYSTCIHTMVISGRLTTCPRACPSRRPCSRPRRHSRPCVRRTRFPMQNCGHSRIHSYIYIHTVSGSGGKASSLKKPHQSFVRLTREAGGESFYFGGKRAASSEANAEGVPPYIHTYTHTYIHNNTSLSIFDVQ